MASTSMEAASFPIRREANWKMVSSVAGGFLLAKGSPNTLNRPLKERTPLRRNPPGPEGRR